MVKGREHFAKERETLCTVFICQNRVGTNVDYLVYFVMEVHVNVFFVFFFMFAGIKFHEFEVREIHEINPTRVCE